MNFLLNFCCFLNSFNFFRSDFVSLVDLMGASIFSSVKQFFGVLVSVSVSVIIGAGRFSASFSVDISQTSVLSMATLFSDDLVSLVDLMDVSILKVLCSINSRSDDDKLSGGVLISYGIENNCFY